MNLQPILSPKLVTVPASSEKVYPHLIITGLKLIGNRLSVTFQQYNYDTKESLPGSEDHLVIKNIYEEMDKRPETSGIINNIISLLTSLYYEKCQQEQ
ncbi:MAG: hypothetical protein WC942_03980 [Clostridia bacterium]|jgi:hypothetical protein